MKNLIYFLSLLLGLSAFGAVPEYQRNRYDTNTDLAAATIVTQQVGGILVRGSNVVAGTLTANGLVTANAGITVPGGQVISLVGQDSLRLDTVSGILHTINGQGGVGELAIGSGLDYDGTTLSAVPGLATGISGAGPTISEWFDSAGFKYMSSYGTNGSLVLSNAGGRFIIISTNMITTSSGYMVGLGTASPTNMLDVRGPINTMGHTNVGNSKITGTLTTAGAITSGATISAVTSYAVNGITVLDYGANFLRYGENSYWLNHQFWANGVCVAQINTSGIQSAAIATATNGFASYATNYVPVAANTVGATNTSLANEIWNIAGTSGTFIFWNRTGAGGSTVGGVALWTNTVIASGGDYNVGPNCGIQFNTAVGTVISRRRM